jgi:hypothetical protein
MAARVQFSVKQARLIKSSDAIAIEFVVDDVSIETLYLVSKRNVTKPIIVHLDGREISRPYILAEIPHGKVLLSYVDALSAEAAVERLNSGEAVIEI